MMMTEQERLDAIQGLRDVADFLDAHPGVPAPRWVTMNVPIDTKEELAQIARLSSWGKDYSGSYFALRKKFAGELTLDVYVERQKVCRKIITGMRMVPAEPAKPEREEAIEEWVCDDAALLPVGLSGAK